ncbi:hypothetical protein Tco_1353209 [Tanacetum coccineum]
MCAMSVAILGYCVNQDGGNVVKMVRSLISVDYMKVGERSFLEKLEWWFEQDIKGEEDEEDEGGDEVGGSKIQKKRQTKVIRFPLKLRSHIAKREHIFEEPSPVHQPSSPPQEQAQGKMAMDDLLQAVPELISRIDSLETDLKQTKLTMGNAIVKLVKKVKKLEGFLIL